MHHSPGREHCLHIILHCLHSRCANCLVWTQQDSPSCPYKGISRGAWSRWDSCQLHSTRYAVLVLGGQSDSFMVIQLDAHSGLQPCTKPRSPAEADRLPHVQRTHHPGVVPIAYRIFIVQCVGSMLYVQLICRMKAPYQVLEAYSTAHHTMVIWNMKACDFYSQCFVRGMKRHVP